MNMLYQDIIVKPEHQCDAGTVIYWHYLNKYPERKGCYFRFIFPDGRQEWVAKGKFHREDGPARTFSSPVTAYRRSALLPGSEYWIQGNRLTEKEWKEYRFKKNLKKVL